MSFNLINISDWPSMPMPLQSEDSGEAWVWGDFFAVLQRHPMIVAQSMLTMTSKSIKNSPMDYPFALTVFYKKNKNPHGPSSMPVLCVALEQTNLEGLAELHSCSLDEIKNRRGSGATPMMIGVFTGSGRLSLGEYKGLVTTDAARTLFFEIVRKYLNLQEDPIRIGAIADVHGHPNTGWPSATKNPKGEVKSGCLAFLPLFIAGTICVGAIIKHLQPSKTEIENPQPLVTLERSGDYITNIVTEALY